MKVKDKKYKKNRKKSFLRIGDIVFPVTSEQYKDYYGAMERWKYIKKLEKGKRLSLDSAIEDGIPLELLSDYPTPDVADEVVKSILIESMLDVISHLGEREKYIINHLFFYNVPLRILAHDLGISHTTLFYQRNKIIKKIKKMMKL